MIAVIIINYRNDRKTIEFVKNEVSKIESPHITVIVNNGSANLSDTCLSETINAGGRTDCYVINSAENLGFARGNNLGADFAKQKCDPDYFLFANNDISILDKDTVDRMAEKLDSIPEAGMIGPKVIGTDGRLQSPEPFVPFADKHILIYWSNLFMKCEKKRIRFRSDYSETAGEGFHYKVMGAFFMTRAKDFFDCGMMDPNTFLYGEETILSERMLKKGKKAYYFPEVSVMHEHGATTRKYYDKIKLRRMKFESDCYYYKTYIGTPDWEIAIAKLTYWLKELFKR
ncbi:MAG: glycosyltransferase family 2 protein [Bacteroidales bacterium]|jgi:GT2 family glycosyltransferase|nr:glycosyltransferase family 2 protein [Bacteroidales bacterium]MCI1784991.1 glycosyltransferase family 2 protein [Bacteroidales bacterium]